MSNKVYWYGLGAFLTVMIFAMVTMSVNCNAKGGVMIKTMMNTYKCVKLERV